MEKRNGTKGQREAPTRWERWRSAIVERSEPLRAVGGSLIMHAFLLVLLASFAVPLGESDGDYTLTWLDADDEEPPRFLAEMETPLDEMLGTSPDPLEASPSVVLDTEEKNDFELPKPQILDSDFADEVKLADLKRISDLAGRDAEVRSALVASQGGNSQSEAAVAAALEWLAAHQNEDGGWSFNHTRAACGDDCTEPGSSGRCTAGATAMALLTFLGAGHTHTRGPYKETVHKGLKYLLGTFEVEKNAASVRPHAPGNTWMYAQGLATIALSEAYLLSEDGDLRRPAQLAVNFIVRAQDTSGGGWRYRPNQPGDTSVVGWQIMALTSARMARLSVPRLTRTRAKTFLASVQTDGGAYYGYTSPRRKLSTTAIGLLCRMYLGWSREQEALERGVAALAKAGPSPENMYYNYYATQVMHHWGGERWKKWNEVMRDQLIRTQSKSGHAKGSWFPRDPHGKRGGRLYMTCLAAMTLEVYYRHLPLYKEGSVAGR